MFFTSFSASSGSASSGNFRAKRALSVLLLASCIWTGPVASIASAQMLQQQSPRLVQGKVELTDTVGIVPKDTKISLNLRDASLRDILNIVAKQGNFNLLLDESVDGTLTVDIKNISINKALEYIFTVSELTYAKDGNTLIVASKDAANQKNLKARTFKTIPVLYRDASLILSQLNQTVFAQGAGGGSGSSGGGGGSSAGANGASGGATGGGGNALNPGGINASGIGLAVDTDSNTLLVMGRESDIKLVTDALKVLDVPRNRKIYRIRYNDPSYVAQLLATNYFGLGTTPGGQQGGGASGGSGGSSGRGGASASGNSGSSGGGGANGGSGGSGGSQQQQGPFVINSGGVSLVAEPIAATLTVMGTPAQLALVDSVISQMDVRRPQVSIEVSLVEMQASTIKKFVPEFGNINFGRFNLSLLPGSTGNRFVNLNWSKTPSSDVGKIPFLGSFNLEAQLNKVKGKVLANPTVVAMDGSKSSISITDEVPTVQTTISQTAGNPNVVATTINKETAGVTLDITPQVRNDGSVVLNMKPTVRQPIRLFQTAGASTFLIAQRSMDINQVRVLDGQTLAIGGLLRDTNTEDVRKVPGLADLPIVGAMFRATSNNQTDRTELVLLVTPHILKDDGVPYFMQQAGRAAGGAARLEEENARSSKPAVAPQQLARPNIPRLKIHRDILK